MLTSETKRHIDAARQVLVGVVPNPTSQIDQITNALIYKFMDDMDQAAIKQGDEPSFFIGDIEKYAWTRLMDTRLGNQERMNLYSEALVQFSQAKQLPELFRSIFKSAFLPYRSPEVLGLFLKEIAHFDYSHPEELGNAYEYLLSIMSSQGDAGQFRTPRHIIDFMVDVINPTKDDKVLDPACGTGGFLVSSYKHILEQHDGRDEEGKPNNEKPLTPDDRNKLIQNFEGYDIDPGMQRIAQVNMYLHQFKNPKIYQYDTLSMEERWKDKFDVILANPPFMSPKGGVKPHSKFSVQSSRSEVLFVDYIMNHLRPKGRAAVIVPDGIIFQSGSAHKQLRKNLVNDGLYAVASLPSGVFQPYSGVKTSILFFDHELAKQGSEILFVKIKNDGFDVSANRRPITKNDLPNVLEILNKWRNGVKDDNRFSSYVEKDEIEKSGDYNLSSGHYQVTTDYSNSKWPMMELGLVCKVVSGFGFPRESQGLLNEEIPFLKVSDMNLPGNEINMINYNNSVSRATLKKLKAKSYQSGTVIFPKIGAAIATNKKRVLKRESAFDNNVMGLLPEKKILLMYLYYLMLGIDLSDLANDAALPSIRKSVVEKYKIPLPPLEFQEQIVAELDGYSGIIDGARKIVENWKPKIDIDPEWKKVALGDISKNKIQSGVSITKKDIVTEGKIKFVNIYDLYQGYEIDVNSLPFVKKQNYQGKYLNTGDLLFVRVSLKEQGAAFSSVYNSGNTNVVYGDNILRLTPNSDVNSMFLNYLLRMDSFRESILLVCNRANVTSINTKSLINFIIPLPPLKIQKLIVDRIEVERALVESAKELIGIYEEKTRKVISKLWEE
ncbi:N-6 DNA methylase [Candidatus Peregrinibacteria bacterium]|jgi:type I restriction enzyme M protein|nr:N-6 DNA methylase [Candidatus Peregrinibacteria bacterium]MBT3598639.1 N-6 DNA methylase [Candidatus Peregrinibacteria bacterium]MBT4367397.1 N-6 DNA methylase [Candidatus Peregrinibacteria bacterium]MBT6730962.1 N-6 DNA methylase [Candidatus Peregrinibacteria bacterium]MBT7009897.1 N-6 DNA methylase [Candidatus Peregrinibacteria bacterium]